MGATTMAYVVEYGVVAFKARDGGLLIIEERWVLSWFGVVFVVGARGIGRY